MSSTITRPMLAATVEDISTLRYPLIASPKLDGIRCLIVDGKAVSRTFKPIPNKYIRRTLEQSGLNNVDGELIVGKNFQETSSAVMSIEGWPYFRYTVFDMFQHPEWEYSFREAELVSNYYETFHEDWFEVLSQTKVKDELDLNIFLDQCLDEKYEGVMLRDPNGPYKCGRSTLKEGYLMKLKPFLDAEAIVIGFEEQVTNLNTATVNSFGLTERSSHGDKQIPNGTLGALIVKNYKDGIVFKIGTGFAQYQRDDIWKRREYFIDKMLTYKYQKYGMKDKPRCPVFLRWWSDV